MMKALFQQKGANLDIAIIASDEAQDFITRHAEALDYAMAKVGMTETMRDRLKHSNYIFSGLKTFHELNEAFPSLTDQNGDRKTFERFLNDVQKVNETYNRNYLRAEYNFVHASASMAARWEMFQKDGDRYLLQYRTAGDDKVRPAHAALNGTTLPITDSFWDSYFPPNGWNCRCTAVQVRRGKYDETPHDEAMQRGENAAGEDKKGIFNFNSGKKQKTFPDYNPYTIKRCNDCSTAQGKADLAYVPDNELCAACRLVHQCAGNKGKTARAIERTHYVKKEMQPLLAKRVQKTISKVKNINVRFTQSGNAHLYSDAVSRSRILQLEDLKDAANILESATFVSDAPKKEAHTNQYEHFYYFEATLHGKKIRLNVGKETKQYTNGRIRTRYVLYSINDIRA